MHAPAPADVQVICAGILVADLFVPPIPSLPAAGQLLATGDFLLDSGGCAANVATGLARLGVPTAAVGMVGADAFGDFVRSDLAAKGVETSGIVARPDCGTSKTAVLTVEGEDRRFIHTFGANGAFGAADIGADRFAAARVLYVGGYLVMPSVVPARLRERLAAARAAGLRTVLDVVVPADDAGRSLGAVGAVLPEVDLFMPNDDEGRTLTGEADAARQAEAFLRGGCGAVVITRGAHGSLYRSRGVSVEVPAFRVDCIDGSGSGDAFAAGCIAAMLEGWPPDRMLRFASAIGASACTRLGCTPGVFTRAEADAFLAEQG